MLHHLQAHILVQRLGYGGAALVLQPIPCQIEHMQRDIVPQPFGKLDGTQRLQASCVTSIRRQATICTGYRLCCLWVAVALQTHELLHCRHMNFWVPCRDPCMLERHGMYCLHGTMMHLFLAMQLSIVADAMQPSLLQGCRIGMAALHSCVTVAC